jgi:uncharacterized MAPEG superfamily protein
MTTLIIAALALALFQLWLLPATLNLSNFSYLISSRDNAIEQSVLQGRVTRAGVNLQESLVAFLALSILAIIQQVDLTQAATIWLAARVLYIPCYMFNLLYLRTIVWLVSLGSLIYMALSFVQ